MPKHETVLLMVRTPETGELHIVTRYEYPHGYVEAIRYGQKKTIPLQDYEGNLATFEVFYEVETPDSNKCMICGGEHGDTTG